MKNYEEIKDYLLNHIDEIGDLIIEINSIDSSLDFLEYWDNDEEFFNTFYYLNPIEAVRSAYYGDYNYCDKYVKFNGYGNLVSFNDYDLEKEHKDYIYEITESLLEHYQELSITDDNLKELIEKYMEEVK